MTWRWNNTVNLPTKTAHNSNHKMSLHLPKRTFVKGNIRMQKFKSNFSPRISQAIGLDSNTQKFLRNPKYVETNRFVRKFQVFLAYEISLSNNFVKKKNQKLSQVSRKYFLFFQFHLLNRLLAITWFRL